MTGSSFWLALRPGVGRVLVLLALLAVVADADARGGRRGGGSRSSSSHSTSHGNDDSSININVRPRTSSSTSSSPGSSPGLSLNGGRTQATGVPAGAAQPAMTPEEEARLAALIAAGEREQAEKAAARQIAAEKAEAERIAAEQAVIARRTAEENARKAEQQKVQREQAAVDADVERVVQRARADYPVLNTPEGEPLLAKIRERQKKLVATGLYPSVAMVRAVADNEYMLRPAARPQMAAVTAGAAAEPAQPATVDGCRWVTPIQWSCK